MHQRLLVLDDEPAVSQTIELIARSAGVDTRATATPEVFFREVEHWSPTHLAIDLVMPGMDGVEVMRLLANLDCRARIIITSGAGNRVLDAARRSASERGLDIVGLLPKPFSPTALRSLLREEGGGYVSQTGKKATGRANSPPVTEADLQRAIRQHEFHLVYQPKVNCHNHKIVGFEALVRWHSPQSGLIMPDQFVPLAETTQLIDPLTAQIIDQSVAWLAECFPSSTISLSINISARSLISTELSQHLIDRCQEFSIDPQRVILELTESSAMEDPVASLDRLTQLRMKGFQLSIDDFGTGYSSMLQLMRLPFSELKIDQSFVKEASQSHESRAVIKAIIDLGHSLGLRVTAEGVEDEQSYDFICSIGCDMVQGYLLARPLARDEVVTWVTKAGRFMAS